MEYDFNKVNYTTVDNIYNKLKEFKDNEKIYTILRDSGDVFSKEDEFEQIFFSQMNDANEFKSKYDNLTVSSIELSCILTDKESLKKEKCNFDGILCSSFELLNAVRKACDKNMVEMKELENMIMDNQLYICVLKNKQNDVMKKNNNIIFFTSEGNAKSFIEKNNEKIYADFDIVKIKNRDKYKELVKESKIVFINEDKHTYPIAILTVSEKRHVDFKEKLIVLEHEDFEELVFGDYYFSIYYIRKIDKYFLSTVVTWVAYYNRYYLIEKEDYELYLKDKEQFLEKFYDIINQSGMNRLSLTGSDALRDYVVKWGGINNAIMTCKHIIWWNGEIWAEVLWNNSYYLAYPDKYISKENEKELKLKGFNNENGELRVYGLKLKIKSKIDKDNK